MSRRNSLVRHLGHAVRRCRCIRAAADLRDLTRCSKSQRAGVLVHSCLPSSAKWHWSSRSCHWALSCLASSWRSCRMRVSTREDGLQRRACKRELLSPDRPCLRLLPLHCCIWSKAFRPHRARGLVASPGRPQGSRSSMRSELASPS
jgi:hypothetical protein